MQSVVKVGYEVNIPYIAPSVEDYLHGNRRLSDLTFEYYGINFEFMMTILVGMLRLNVTLIPLNTSSVVYDSFKDGTIDIPLRIYPQTRIISKDAGYSPAVDKVFPIFIVARNHRIRSVSILDNFKPELWILVSVFTLLVLAVKMAQKRVMKRMSIMKRVDSISFVIWFLVLGMFFGLFSNLLTMDFLQSRTQLVYPFKNMMDLALQLKSNRCELFLMRRDYFDINPAAYDPAVSLYCFGRRNATFHTRKESWGSLIYDAQQSGAFKLFDNRQAMVESVKQMSKLGRCAVGVDFNILEPYYKSKCGVVIMPPSLVSEVMVKNGIFLYSKRVFDDATIERLNRVVSTSSVQHFYRRISERYFAFNANQSVRRHCKISEKNVNGLTLLKVGDGFKLFISGILLAFTLFGIELFYKLRQFVKL